MNWIIKKISLSTSFVLLLVYIVSYYNKVLELPSAYKDFCCLDDRTLNLFLIFVPLFIFTAILNSFKEKDWGIWSKFSKLYLIAYFIVYFLVPSQGDGLIWFQRETISFFGSLLYSAISLIIILYKSLKK